MSGRFDKVKEILAAIWEMAPDDRAAYLDAECGDDTELRKEVEDLLAFDDGETFLETILGTVKPPTANSRSNELGHETPPDTIGRYTVSGELGRGGMGIVYLAEDPQLQRQIAIKVLPPSLCDRPDSLRRFQQEARLLAAMTHPHIAMIHTLEEADDLHFLTLEYVPGETMAEQIVDTVWSVERTLSIGRQVASALESAHKRGVIHRDLKPQNIKITPEGQAKVLDFGIAKSLHVKSEETLQGLITGTPGYMSPEQLRGEHSDVQSDVWALGCTLFAALAGRSPFMQTSTAETMSATLDQEPRWDEYADRIPEPLRALLAGCLEKDRERRISSMAEVRQAIDSIQASQDAGMSRETPAPKAKVAHNIPRALTRFFGRDEERAQLEDLLESERIVTVVGPGGCGKTRIALELASSVLNRYPDGAWFVELAGISEPSQIEATVASVLKVETAAGQATLDAIRSSLGTRSMLLVLDNAEHLLDACRSFVAEIGTSPNLRILTTSQVPLGVAGESLFPLVPLPTPAEGQSVAEIQTNPAVVLFADRAQAVDPDFELTQENAPAVGEICRRLDGLPLAIELAAARTSVFPPEDLKNRIDARFKILNRGAKTASPRHRTLRALIDWSYELLETNERVLLRRLSAFAGGWTLEAAEAVCADVNIEEWEVLDLFTNLLERSFVFRDRKPIESHLTTRYRMYESVREYAKEQLENEGEATITRRKHRGYFADLVRQSREKERTAEQRQWHDRIAADHENVRAAIEFALADDEGAKDGLRMVGDLDIYWWAKHRREDGLELTKRVLAHPGGQKASVDRATALEAAAVCSTHLWQRDDARTYREASLQAWLEVGTEMDIARAQANLANTLSALGEADEAARLYDEALVVYRDKATQSQIATLLHNVGFSRQNREDFASSKAPIEECIAIKRKLGDKWGTALALDLLAGAAENLEEFENAILYRAESAELFGEAGFGTRKAEQLTRLSEIELNLGRMEAAGKHLGDALDIWSEVGSRGDARRTAIQLARWATMSGDHRRGGLLLGLAQQLKEEGDGFWDHRFPGLEAEVRTSVSAALGDEETERLVVEGRGLTLPEAEELVGRSS